LNISFKYQLSFICLLLTNALLAQQSLSLSKAIQIGLRNNFDISIAAYNRDLATSNRDRGVPNRYPTIDFFLSQENGMSLDNSPTSFVDGAYTQAEIDVGLDLDWVLFNGFQVRINKHRLGLLEELGIGEAQLLTENTIQAIVLAYYKALIEQEKLKITQATIDYSLQKYRQAQLELQYGEISNFDLYNFKSALLQDSINYQQQEIVLKEAFIQLNFIIDAQNPNQSYQLIEKLEYSGKQYKYKDLKNRLLVSNQDIKNQFTNMKLMENDLELTRARNKPVIRLRSRVSEELSTSKFTDESRINGAVFDFYVNFSLNYNLFDGGNVKRRIEEAEVKNLVAKVEVEKAKIKLEEKLLISHSQYEQQIKILRTRLRLVESLKENLQIAYERMLGGHSIFIEYRDIQIQLVEAEFALLESIFNLKVTEIEIIKLIGGITKIREK